MERYDGFDARKDAIAVELVFLDSKKPNEETGQTSHLQHSESAGSRHNPGGGGDEGAGTCIGHHTEYVSSTKIPPPCGVRVPDQGSHGCVS